MGLAEQERSVLHKHVVGKPRSRVAEVEKSSYKRMAVAAAAAASDRHPSRSFPESAVLGSLVELADRTGNLVVAEERSRVDPSEAVVAENRIAEVGILVESAENRWAVRSQAFADFDN